MLQSNRYFKQKTLILAMTSALASMASLHASATGPVCAASTISASTSNGVVWSSGGCVVNSGVVISSTATALSVGASVATLTNNGTLSAANSNLTITTYGIANLSAGTIVDAIVNSSSGSISGYFAIRNAGIISTLTNDGSISSSIIGIRNDSGGTIGLLSNSGNIVTSGSYGNNAIVNVGLINELINNSNATISSAVQSAIQNLSGTINTLTNDGFLSGQYGIYNNNSTSIVGEISTLNNNGIINATNKGIVNEGLIGSLTNNGTITGTTYSVLNDGTITSFNNASDGHISGGYVGIRNDGTILNFVNAGSISGTQYGIQNENYGNIATLTNSGTISGVTAISTSAIGTLGTIANSGLISGKIVNRSSNALNLTGGSGSSFGTLTGESGSIGTISSTVANVNFLSGNLLLNDNINVGSNTVNNTGATLQVNNVLTITGNYSQSADASLLIGVADGATSLGSISDAGYGRLIVSGSAVIASGSTITLQKLNSYAFASGQRFLVIQAATSGTSYNQSSLNYSASGYSGNITGTIVSDGSNSDLVVLLGSSSGSNGSTNGLATTPTAISSLAGISRYTGLNASLMNLWNAVAAMEQEGSTTTANSVGAKLSASAQGSTAKAAAAPMLDVLNVVSAHSDSLRLARDTNGSGISSGEAGTDKAVWGQAFGGHANQGSRDQIDGYTANYGGLLLGADKQIDDRWNAGAVISYGSTSIRNTGYSTGNTSNVSTYGLFGYASYTGSPWYVNFATGVASQHYKTGRVIDFSGFSGATNATFNGMQYVTKLEGGYPLTYGVYTVTPLIGMTYSHTKQNAYTESGGNGAALSVGATGTTSVQSDIGARVERSFETSSGTIVPSLKLAWRHEYNNNRQLTTSSYAADATGETSFTTYGTSPITNSAVLSLGATLLRANNLSLTVRYEVQAASGFVSQGGSVRLRQLF